MALLSPPLITMVYELIKQLRHKGYQRFLLGGRGDGKMPNCPNASGDVLF